MQTILKIDEVTDRTGISKSSIYAQVKDGTFPPPFKLGERAIRWTDSEITEWINQRILASRGTLEPWVPSTGYGGR